MKRVPLKILGAGEKGPVTNGGVLVNRKVATMLATQKRGGRSKRLASDRGISTKRVGEEDARGRKGTKKS